jgi:hypothetical protein
MIKVRYSLVQYVMMKSLTMDNLIYTDLKKLRVKIDKTCLHAFLLSILY